MLAVCVSVLVHIPVAHEVAAEAVTLLLKVVLNEDAEPVPRPIAPVVSATAVPPNALEVEALTVSVATFASVYMPFHPS